MSEKTLGLSEHAARNIALKYHPEWRRAMQKGGLPAQIGDNGEFIDLCLQQGIFLTERA